MLGLLKRVAKGASREVAAELGQNKDYLEAVCAGSALVAAADGEIEDEERKAIPGLIAANPTLAKLYQREQIEKCMESMLSRATSTSGKLWLQRELQDLRGKEKGSDMAADVIAVMIDVAGADGEIEEPERKAIAKVAGWIGVDIKQFEF